MNLTDLQVELRAIEDRLAVLWTEIEKMKPRPQNEQQTNFEKITALAAQYPFKNKLLAGQPELVQKEYLSLLSYISLLNKEHISEKLLYITRIAAGIVKGISAETIYRMGLEYNTEDLNQACNDLQSIRCSLLTDALILANIAGEAAPEMLSAVADVAELMKADREEIGVAAMVAKAVLTDDFDILDKIPTPSENRWSGKFTPFIPEEWLAARRVFCGKIFEGWKFDGENKFTPFEEIEHRAITGKVVKKEEPLVVFNQCKSSGRSILMSFHPDFEKCTIKAPHNGIVFYTNDIEVDYKRQKKYLYVYVVSYFDDYNDFCTWDKQNQDKKRR